MNVVIDWNAPKTTSVFETHDDTLEEICAAIVGNMAENTGCLVDWNRDVVVCNHEFASFHKTTDRRDWEKNKVLSFSRSVSLQGLDRLSIQELLEASGWIVVSTEQIRKQYQEEQPCRRKNVRSCTRSRKR